MLVFSYDLFIVLKWRPRWTWNRHAYRDALYFGVNRMASNVTNSGRKMVESTAITHYFLFTGLGVFGRAEGLANMFCGRIAAGCFRTLSDHYRANPASERFQKIAGLVLRSVAWVIIPIAVWFSFEASAITNLLYGNKWNSVISLLPLTMLIGCAQALGGCTYSLLLANEARRQCIRSDVFAMLLIVGCVLVLMPMGLKTYLAGASLAHILIGIVLLTLLVRSGGIKSNGLLIALFPPLLASGLGVAVMLAVGKNILLPASLIVQTGWPEQSSA